MKCPKCYSAEKTKNGILHSVQRYKCKSCGYGYTVESRCGTRPSGQKRQALLIYLDGFGFRSIGRILTVHNTTVYLWIKNFGRQIDVIRNYKSIKIMQLDVLHIRIESKSRQSGS